jgi:hypothetical protein
MRACGGVVVYINIFEASALAGGEWSASRPGRYTPGERSPDTHWIGGWVDPRTGLDDEKKRKFLTLPGLERPARNQSRYRLRYSGCSQKLYAHFNRGYLRAHPQVVPKCNVRCVV